ncbi:MAG: DUF4860 domain-containing protein [Solobacterium sp.]|jgi:hypothetical protein|nr:DUF4860 domain-containing protein [Solobacterium sp.]MCH4222930.1 DUF4860 domain-containing protein [Solobacterium sp.]MCH4266189.1 DUF4860 domain-containing protein [Solobacterium sp.]
MKNTRKNHSIDVLFPVVLLLLFAILAITVVLLSAKTYQHIVARSSENYNSRTAISYVKEKVRQNDVEGGVEAGSFNGQSALILHSDGYSTYLYEYDGNLCELFLKDGAEAELSSGTPVITCTSFQIEMTTAHLLSITCVDDSSNTYTASIAIQSEGIQP